WDRLGVRRTSCGSATRSWPWCWRTRGGGCPAGCSGAASRGREPRRSRPPTSGQADVTGCPADVAPPEGRHRPPPSPPFPTNPEADAVTCPRGSKLCRVGAVICLGLLAACSGRATDPIGRDAPVVNADIPALALNHYFTREGKARFDVFSWTFTETRFTVRPGRGPVASELLERLLPEGAAGQVIECRWALEESLGGGQYLVLHWLRGDR